MTKRSYNIEHLKTGIMKQYMYKLWDISLDKGVLTVKLGTESREYIIGDVETVVQSGEYLYLTRLNEVVQLKFEIDDLLVIDIFNLDGEHIDCIGSHVFGE